MNQKLLKFLAKPGPNPASRPRKDPSSSGRPSERELPSRPASKKEVLGSRNSGSLAHSNEPPLGNLESQRELLEAAQIEKQPLEHVSLGNLNFAGEKPPKELDESPIRPEKTNESSGDALSSRNQPKLESPSPGRLRSRRNSKELLSNTLSQNATLLTGSSNAASFLSAEPRPPALAQKPSRKPPKKNRFASQLGKGKPGQKTAPSPIVESLLIPSVLPEK